MSFKLDFVYYKKSSSERAPPPHFSGECRFKTSWSKESANGPDQVQVAAEVRMILRRYAVLEYNLAGWPGVPVQ